MADEKEFTGDRDWSLPINVSGLAPATGQRLDEGFYKGPIDDMYVRVENKGRVVIRLSLNGNMRTTGINIPKDDQDTVRYYWRSLAESAGYDPADLDKGEVKLNLKSFKDRIVHVKYTPKEKTDSGYDDIKFFPPAMWTQQRQLFEGDTAGKSETKTEEPALGGGASGTVSKEDVVAGLGL